MVEKLIECGVENVIGFSGETTIDDCNAFAQLFYEYTIGRRYSVQKAVSIINSNRNFDNLTRFLVRGYLHCDDPDVFLSE